VWKTVRELAKSLDVTVVTAETPVGAREDAQMSLPDDVRVLRLRDWKPAPAKLRRVSEKLLGLLADEAYLWAKGVAVQSTLNATGPFDILYSRSHPGASHILAYRLKQALDKPWVAQFSDPWANNPYHRDHTALRKSFDTRWERRVVESADVLVFPTHEIQEMYVRDYPSLGIVGKSVVLPHHYAPELYDEPLKEKATQSGGKVSFAYFGDFYGKRSPAPLIEALNRLVQQDPAVSEQLGIEFFGNIERKFHDLVQRSPVAIKCRKVSYLESLREMTRKDILLLIDAPSETGVNPFLASKLVDYLGTGKRILGITDVQGTAAELLRRYGHFVVRPDDTAGIAHAVETCLASPHQAVARPPEYTSRFVIGQLERIFDDLTPGRP